MKLELRCPNTEAGPEPDWACPLQIGAPRTVADQPAAGEFQLRLTRAQGQRIDVDHQSLGSGREDAPFGLEDVRLGDLIDLLRRLHGPFLADQVGTGEIAERAHLYLAARLQQLEAPVGTRIVDVPRTRDRGVLVALSIDVLDGAPHLDEVAADREPSVLGRWPADLEVEVLYVALGVDGAELGNRLRVCVEEVELDFVPTPGNLERVVPAVVRPCSVLVPIRAGGDDAGELCGHDVQEGAGLRLLRADSLQHPARERHHLIRADEVHDLGLRELRS